MAESPTDLIRRALAEIEKGKASEPVGQTFGAKEAVLAAEHGHDGGKGAVKTNEPGSAGAPEKAPNPQEDSKGNENITGTGPVPSAGNRRSALPGPPAQSGVVDIRRMAAMKELESEKSSGGNKFSNTPGKEMPPSERVGNVQAPAGEPPDRNKALVEGVPPFSKESLSGDGWGKAAAKAKQMFAAKK